LTDHHNSKSMPDQLRYLDSRHPLAGVLLIALIILVLMGVWFSVRWYIGNTIAEYFDTQEGPIDTMNRAVRLAPLDPLTHWTLGDVLKNRLTPDQIGQAVTEFERAVSLSPNDYRYWMALGSVLEQSGDVPRAEASLRRAVELAPAYSYPRWYLGNLLLRSGRNTEAFIELRRASEADSQLGPQVFSLAWEVYGQNFEALTAAIGTSATTRAELCEYLVGRQRYDDGLRLWNVLSANEKQDHRSTADSIIKSLAAAKRYHGALAVWNDVAPAATLRATIGQVLNGGLEDDPGPAGASIFGWQVKSTPQAQVAIDAGRQHAGARSLRIIFQARTNTGAMNISQLVAVEPSTQYELEYYVKTDALQSGGPPLIEILDASASTVLVTSEPAATGSNNWQRMAVSFTTPGKAEAISIRINRASCGEDQACPIFGTVWYDDFNLKRRS
jgi:tetratricopeptide (TPR) repeat protein